MKEQRKLFGHWCGLLAESRAGVASTIESELTVYKQVALELGMRVPKIVIEKEGYRVEVRQEKPVEGKTLRVLRLDPDVATEPMRLQDDAPERRRYVVEGQAGILRARGQGVVFIDMGDCDINLPEDVEPGDVACMIAGPNGAVIIDLTSDGFDPKTMETRVEPNDPSIPDEFWRIRG